MTPLRCLIFQLRDWHFDVFPPTFTYWFQSVSYLFIHWRESCEAGMNASSWVDMWLACIPFLSLQEKGRDTSCLFKSKLNIQGGDRASQGRSLCQVLPLPCPFFSRHFHSRIEFLNAFCCYVASRGKGGGVQWLSGQWNFWLSPARTKGLLLLLLCSVLQAKQRQRYQHNQVPASFEGPPASEDDQTPAKVKGRISVLRSCWNLFLYA